MPSQLTIPVQVLFTTVTEEGVVLDCTVTEEVCSDRDQPIPPGSPFSLVIEEPSAELSEVAAGAAVRPRIVDLLHRWCDEGVVVHAVTSASSSRLVLRHGSDEVVLEIL